MLCLSVSQTFPNCVIFLCLDHVFEALKTMGIKIRRSKNDHQEGTIS